VRTTGAGYCWGYNGLGQLGNPSAGTSYQPIPIAGGLTFTSIASVCGIRVESLRPAPRTAGVRISSASWATARRTRARVPWPSLGATCFLAVATGVFASCGLTSAGAAFCWGDNAYHQMGDSITQSSFPRQVAGGVTFTTLTVGGAHTCGLVSSGAAYCWGANSSGQLGQRRECQQRPSRRRCRGTGLQRYISGYPLDVRGDDERRGVLLGIRGNGELGNGTTDSTNVPVAVSGGLTFTAIQTGDSHSCALTSGGTVYCWGNDYYGQLGRGVLGFCDSARHRTAVAASVRCRGLSEESEPHALILLQVTHVVRHFDEPICFRAPTRRRRVPTPANSVAYSS